MLFYLLLIGLIFPYEATVIPLYYVFKDVGLTDSLWALILPQIGLSIPFGTFWMRAFFRSTPIVARGGVAAGRRVELLDPLARAAAAGVAGADDADRARVHVDVERVPARAGDDPERRAAHRAARARALRRAPTAAADPTLTAAAAVLVALPIVIVYVFLQRSFIRGMFAGAVKE